MNFLAHIYLSGNDKKLQVGNFIGDFVKGRSYQVYPDIIQKGILLHREIDTYTDKNKITHEIKSFYKFSYRKYSGIISDMIIDHYLAKNWCQYSKISLDRYSKQFYFNLIKNYRYLPKKVKYFLPFMIQSNRLESYSRISGIQNALERMESYSSLPKKSKDAIEITLKHYTQLEQLSKALLAEAIGAFLP